MFKLKITSQAKAQLSQITKKHHQIAISKAFDDLKEDPFIGKPLLRELTGKFSYKVGVYRIIYIIKKQEKIVTILYAGHRATVYN